MKILGQLENAGPQGSDVAEAYPTWLELEDKTRILRSFTSSGQSYCQGKPSRPCKISGVQPQQDPGGTLRMNGVGEREREKTCETSLDRAKSVREREKKERERERERETRQGVQTESGNALFFTVAFRP